MSKKNLVIYTYFEKDNIYKDNLMFFLKMGLCDECDYIFVINGECSVNIPNQSNIKILRRDNKDYDFGGFAHALNFIDIDKYNYYIFLNTSVRGPFIPPYANIKWYEAFTNMIKGDVKLVGVTINILNSPHSGHSQIFESITGIKRPHTHVQSYFFAMDKECLSYIINSTDIFRKFDYKDFADFIVKKELMMSQLVLKNGWNIGGIVQEYKDIDFRKLEIDISNSYIYENDPVYPNNCFGRTLHPYECIFIKINRGISVNEINSLSRYIFEKN